MADVREYYRVLLTKDHYDRWTAGQYNSFHGNNGEWWDKWKKTKSTQADDYPLGLFTAEARAAFLRFAQSGQQQMTAEERRDTEQFAGVCAFETSEAAFEYGGRLSPPTRTWYVTFEGEYVGPLPEGGGVVARVLAPFGAVMTPEQFMQAHNVKP